MGQVPKLKYLLIGSGRLSQHLNFYFKNSNLNVATWARNASSQDQLSAQLSAVDVILLAISDQNLGSFFEEQVRSAPELRNKTWVHFSGAYTHPHIVGLHPLMSFGEDLYEADVYKSIPFISEKRSTTFRAVFPSLQNPSFEIPVEKKALYHAYCVMSGNFTQLLWWMAEEAFERELGLPSQALLNFKSQVFANTLKNSKSALTGPLVRNDWSTIDKHLTQLNKDQAELYRQFIKLYQTLSATQTSPALGGNDEHLPV